HSRCIASKQFLQERSPLVRYQAPEASSRPPSRRPRRSRGIEELVDLFTLLLDQPAQALPLFLQSSAGFVIELLVRRRGRLEGVARLAANGPGALADR